MTYVLVGWGYRSRAWWEAGRGIGAACAGVVVRTPRETPGRAFGSLTEALAATGARLVVVSVSPEQAPGVVREAVAAGVGVLVETPPAADDAGLAALWGDVGASGLIGTPTQVQVSSTQLHHAAALMRAHLGWPAGPVRVTATRVEAPLLQPLSRAGWTGAAGPTATGTTHAVLDFGDGRSGIYDFTDQQTRNLLRFRRLVVRGTHGELDSDTALHWGGPETILTSRLERRQSGHDLDMSGFDSETISHGESVLWRNPWPGLRWSDDQLATATLLRDALAWVDGGPDPDPLARGCADAALGFAIERAVREGRPVDVAPGPWV